MGTAKQPSGKTFDKIQRFCAYQERCSFDVEQKLRGMKIPQPEIAEIIRKLTLEGFLNDQRFAKAFVRGKFRINKWGRNKIGFELKSRNIEDKLIREAIKEIDEEEYRKTIRDLILKKKSEIKAEKNLNIREKMINFAAGKGYEFDTILDTLKTLNL